MVLDYKQQHLDRLRDGLSLAVLPIQYAVAIPQGIYRGISLRTASRQGLITQNERLKDEVLQLEQQLQKLLALEAENNRLKSLLKTSARPGDKIAMVEIMRVAMDPHSHKAVINRGYADNVFEGQPIIDSAGILGQVIRVGPKTSTVLLLTDKQHAIPVQSQRSGARALAVGSGDYNVLQLNHVTATSDFKIGDKLISSGLGLRFPKGYPVGEVIDVQIDTGEQFAVVKAKPYAQADSVNELLLIWPEEQEAQVSLEDEAEQS
jgi:rod shape-determining protein MreC